MSSKRKTLARDGRDGQVQERNDSGALERVMREKAFDKIRQTALLETHAEQLIQVLSTGTISTNVYLRRLHNFALEMNWLPAPIIPSRQ